MKLTKAQAQVIDRAKSDIDYARTHDFIHWIAKHVTALDLDTDWDAHPNAYLSNAQALQDALDVAEKDNFPTVIDGFEIFPAGYWKMKYEGEKNGVTITIASSNTLRALQRLGLIEIIKDAGRGVDTIRLLNY